MPEFISIDAMPFALGASKPGQWGVEGDDVVAGIAPPLTDLFVDPGGDAMESAQTASSAPRLTGSAVQESFQFAARVTVDFRALFDAGALIVSVDSQNWAKLCFEYGPARQPLIVSVVTRDVSDDANSFFVDGDTCWLRVSRVGRLLAFHASPEGNGWSLVRVFTLPHLDSAVELGFLVQSPTGDGCAAAFDHIEFTSDALDDLRSGR